MSRIYTRRTMAGIFILVCTVYFVFAVANKPRILVLHSYAPDYIWVRKVTEGIRSVLDDSPYVVRWHYMDTKRHPDPEFRARAGMTARRVIDKWKPQVVIAIDDHAQQYVARCFVEGVTGDAASKAAQSARCLDGDDEISDTSVEIVYTGVNAGLEEYGYKEATNVAGLLQRLPLDLVKRALLDTFRPECAGNDKSGTDCSLDILYLRDSSTTSAWREREIVAADWAPEIRLTPRAVKTFAEWRNAILEANPAPAPAAATAATESYDLLLFSDYRQLTLPNDEGLASGDDVVAWNGACSEIPMVGLGSSYGETGEALSFSVAPFEQGVFAAASAVDIVEGRETPGQQVSEGFVVYIRGELEGGHKVPALYQAFAHATGTHFEEAPAIECRGPSLDSPG